jgi:hypothetical protein
MNYRYLILSGYLILCVLNVALAAEFRIKMKRAFLLSLVFTPWIGIVCIYLSGKKSTRSSMVRLREEF